MGRVKQNADERTKLVQVKVNAEEMAKFVVIREHIAKHSPTGIPITVDGALKNLIHEEYERILEQRALDKLKRSP